MSGENRKAWFIWLRVATPIRLAFWGECWPKRPKARCYTCGRVCRGPTAWVGAPCVRAAPTDTSCVGGPVPTGQAMLKLCEELIGGRLAEALGIPCQTRIAAADGRAPVAVAELHRRTVAGNYSLIPFMIPCASRRTSRGGFRDLGRLEGARR
jgi:hypothetical protein